MKMQHRQFKSISISKRFSDLRQKELNEKIFENKNEEEEKNNDLINKLQLIKMMNSEQIEDSLNELVYSEKAREDFDKHCNMTTLTNSSSSSSLQKKKLDLGQNVNVKINPDLNFGQTKYASIDSVTDFYTKYHLYSEVERKGNLEVPTPSFAFIKSTLKNKLIPNPIGLLKRSGDEKKIDLT